MTIIYEKQIWCADCRRHHVIKLYSPSMLDEQDKARFFIPGDYTNQLMRHCVCAGCGGSITPHSDIDILAIEGQWKESCLECFRKGSLY